MGKKIIIMASAEELIEASPSSKIIYRLLGGFIAWVFYYSLLITIIRFRRINGHWGTLHLGGWLGLLIECFIDLVILILVLRRVIGKSYSGHRLVLLSPVETDHGAASVVEMTPPWKALFGIWWAFVWRSNLWYIPPCLAELAIDKTPEFLGSNGQTVVFLIKLFFFVLVSLSVLQRLLGKEFSGKRLVFLTAEAGATADNAITVDSAALQ